MNDRAPGGSGSDRNGTAPDRPWLQHSRGNAASTRSRQDAPAGQRSQKGQANRNGNAPARSDNGAVGPSMPGPRPGGSGDNRNGGGLPHRSLQTPNTPAGQPTEEASPLQAVKARTDSLKSKAAERRSAKAAKAEARRQAEAQRAATQEQAPEARTGAGPSMVPAAPSTSAPAAAPTTAAPAAPAPSSSVAIAPTVTAKKPTTSPRRQPRTRKARLRVTKIDPWSVMKISFLLSIAFGIVTVVMVYVVWTAIAASSLFPDINNVVNKVVLGGQAGSVTQFRVQDYVHTNKIMGVTTLIAGVDVLIFTALATLGSFLYNLAASLLGGFELTLASDD